MDMMEFLSLVSPGKGTIFVGELKESGYFSNHACHSHDEVAETTARLDARTRNNIYFSCASFKQDEYFDERAQKMRSRTKVNAAYAKAFWRDIDVGYNKKGDKKPNAYDSQEDAIDAIDAVCVQAGLPQPLLVSSGKGIHAYWPLTRQIKADAWNEIARILYRVMQKHGFKCDGSRDTDIASVLRLPETHNKYHDATLDVTVLRGAEPIAPEDFLAALEAQDPGEDRPTRTDSALPAYLRGADISTTASVAQMAPEYPPCDADKLASNCAQIRHFKETGSQSYVNWWPALGAIKHCIDGEKIAHQWSSTSKDYDADLTQFKLNDWTAAPPTCDAFSNFEGLCDGCSFKAKVKSPISLGIPDVVEPPKPEQLDEHTPQEVVSFILPEGYAIHKGAIYKIVETPEGENHYAHVCAVLFWFEDRFCDTDGTMAYRVKMRVRKGACGKWQYRSFSIPSRIVGKGGSDLYAALAQYEIMPSTTKGGKVRMDSYVAAMADELRRRKEEIKAYRTFGWQEDGSFIIGRKAHRPDGSEQEIVPGGEMSMFLECFAENASTDVAGNWAEVVQRMYAFPDHEQYQIVVLKCLGAPLYKFFSAPIGSITNIIGAAGSGKTTVALVGMSAYGSPNLLGAEYNSTTEQAFYSRLSTLNSLPSLLDETTNLPPDLTSRLIYTIGNGRPRDRLQSSGKRNTALPPWTLPVIMGSNESMQDKLSFAKADATAELTRMIEISWRNYSAHTREEMDALITELRPYWGSAGTLFAKYCVENQDKVRKQFDKLRAMVEAQAGLTREQRFWSADLAVPLLTLHIMQSKLGLLEKFSFDTLFSYLITLAKSHLSGMKDLIMAPDDMFHSMLTDLSDSIIVTNIAKDARIGVQPDHVIIRSKPVGRVLRESGEFYIDISAIRDWCAEHRASYRRIKSAVSEMGILLGEKKFYLGKGTTMPTGQSYCLLLDWNKLQQIDTAITNVTKLAEKRASMQNAGT